MSRESEPRRRHELSAHGAILLVSCYELGHQPFSLASPLAGLAQAGYHPRAVDTAVDELTDGDMAQARLIAISVPMHTALRLGERIARRVRAVNPRAHVTFYGLYAWLNAEYLLQTNETDGVSAGDSSLIPHLSSLPLADSVIGGEFEQPLVNLARSLQSDGARAEGVRYPDRLSPPWIARPALAVPDRQSLPDLNRYAGFRAQDGRVVPAGYVEATRGCKHTCLHCPITPVYNGRFFAVPREIVLEDLRQQVRAGARHITFGDPDFLNGPTHALRIVRAMHQEFSELTFDATIKIEHILEHHDLFPELKSLGCAFVVSAVESLSDTVLACLRKGHTSADVPAALDVLGQAGIPMRPSLLSFTPWTTLADYLDVLHFVEARNLIDNVDPVHYAIRLLVPPGSALLDLPDTAEWLGPLDQASYSYTWKHPDARMDALHQAVAAIVEEAEVQKRDAYDTFAAVKRAAHLAAGLSEPPTVDRQPVERWLPPKLTESWFC